MNILRNKDGELDSDLVYKLVAAGVVCVLVMVRGLGPMFGADHGDLPGNDTIMLALGWLTGHAGSYAVKRKQG